MRAAEIEENVVFNGFSYEEFISLTSNKSWSDAVILQGSGFRSVGSFSFTGSPVFIKLVAILSVCVTN